MKPRFMVWLKQAKTICQAETIDFALNGDMAYVVPEISTLGDPKYRAYNPKEVVLLLSTGLRDKNGVEIFEGHIVEHRYNSPLSGELVVHRFQVAWDEMYSRFCTIGIGLRHGIDLSNSASSRHLEVIGNIYENPELLEEVE